MPLNDLSSLLQLSVGTNLGFGALASFYEPLSTKTEQSLSVIDQHLDEIVGRYGNDAAEAGRIFQITKLYSELAQWLGVLQLERRLWEGSIARMTFMMSGVISFVCLLIVSLAAESTSEPFFAVMAILAVATNLPPLVFAGCMCIVAIRHETTINPRLERIQNQLYENFVKPDLKDSDVLA